jgi:hypothetical protein
MSFDALVEQYPALPPMALLKVDVLRSGVRLEAPIGSRYFHHHDEAGQKAVPDARAHMQGSIELPGGVHVFVRHNAKSPYALVTDPETGAMWLADGADQSHITEVTPGPRLQWPGQRTSRGTPNGALFSPSLGGACGPIAIFLLRHCEFVVNDDECRFCSWVRMGKSTEMRPNVEDMREAIGTVWSEQGSVGYLAFSGGSLFNRTKEADAFLSYMHAARDTGARLPPTVAAIQALDRADSARLKAAGFDYVCYSMEVWGDALWPEVMPGKSKSVGRERWMDCLKEAVDVFGPGRVMCNFVAGVETAVPGAYASPEAAADHTLEGLEWCYQQGIYPKYSTWIVSGGAMYSDRRPAPLEYYARFLPGRQQLYASYALPIPAIDCPRCLTESLEADLARLDPARYALGPAAEFLAHRDHGAVRM